MICTATYGSGVKTGMRIIRLLLYSIPLVRLRAPSGCFATAAGSTTPGTAGPPTAAGTSRPSGTAASVSGSRAPQVSSQAGRVPSSNRPPTERGMRVVARRSAAAAGAKCNGGIYASKAHDLQVTGMET